MTERDRVGAWLALTSLAMAVGANRKEQEALIEAMKDIQQYQTTPEKEVQAIVGMFYTGLAYGNWPWIVNGVSVLK